MGNPSSLLSLVSQASKHETPAGIQVLVNHLCQRYGQTIEGILFYGSCLRRNSDHNGLVDLYVLVNNNRATAPNTILAALNKILPPNVYYLELSAEDRVVRAKYSVLTLSDFKKATSPAWFHSYFWGRFAQPTSIVYSASEQATLQIQGALAQAVLTCVQRVRPQMPASFHAREFWETAFTLSYGAELRAEPSDRIRQLIEDNPEYYEQITEAACSGLFDGISVDTSTSPTAFRQYVSSGVRRRNWWIWRIRQIIGKGLSVLRLLKGVFTFHGGLDYILWKIERHSGIAVEITPTQRKHPILTGVFVFWKLYRQGAFR